MFANGMSGVEPCGGLASRFPCCYNRPGMKVESLRTVPLFRNLDDSAAFELCNLLTVREEPGGTPLFYRGDPGDAMYLIETGRVRISVKDADGHDATLADLHDGEFFGEMAILDEQPRSADATVVANTRLAVLSRSDFREFLHKNPDIALGILTAMIRRLRRTDEILRHRVSRNVNDEEAAQLTMADRAADMIAKFGGSWKFIGASVAFCLLWILVNTYVLVFKHPFDAFPFTFLNLVLGIIAGLQAPIIMMSQNREGQKDRLRADLDYRVNLKNELLLSEVLQRLTAIESAIHAKPPDYIESESVKTD
jgi:CRP/FNR family transcriptional regulator, cyclic AMP receptor protein